MRLLKILFMAPFAILIGLWGSVTVFCKVMVLFYKLCTDKNYERYL